MTAASYAVSVRVDPTGLVIADDSGSAIGAWRWDDLRLSEPVAAGRPVRLSNRAVPGARLAIEDTAILTILRQNAPFLSRDPFDRARIRLIAGILAACAAIVLFFIYGLPWIARPVASLVPVAWEEPVGDSTVAIVNALFAEGRALCRDPDGAAALETMRGKLAATVDTPYTIRVDVVDSNLVNALAAPGGRVVVFRGLIDRAKRPDEIAGVLAHEMAHVIRRHPTQGMINMVGWSSLVSVFTGGASLSNEAVARLGAHLATSAYTRALESEADATAAVILAQSGIGSEGLARFFRMIEEQEVEGPNLPAYLSTHPRTEDRINAVERHRSAPAAPALTDEEWKSLRKICRKSGR